MPMVLNVFFCYSTVYGPFRLGICDGSLRLVDMPGQDETDNPVVKVCLLLVLVGVSLPSLVRKFGCKIIISRFHEPGLSGKEPM